MNPTVWSYLVSAAAFGVAGAFIPAALPLRHAPRIRWALLTCAAWALLLAAHGGGDIVLTTFLTRAIPLAEVLYFGAVLLLLDTLANGAATRWLRQVNVWGTTAAALYGLLVLLDLVPLGAHSGVGLALALLGLVNAEQLLRNAPPPAARAIKFCVVGIGGQLVYDLFVYSQAQLLGGFEVQSWAMRGFVFAALLPLLWLGLDRLAKEQPRLFVSRQMVFYTSAFLAVGIYLVVMAIGGYYVRVHGGSWGESLRLLFFAGAIVVLALLVLSPSLWRRWRVFVAKHFFRNKYDYRVEWLRFIDTLSDHDDPDARITAIRAIAQILESPGGLLFQRNEEGTRYELAASWSQQGLAPPEPALEASHDLPRFLADRQWVVDLREYRRDPGLYRNIALPDWLAEAQGWRIVTPLLELDELLGFMVLMAPPEPFQMTFEDRDLLRTVGRHVATLLAQQASDRKLAESRQFDAFNRFAAFVMHDLKNSVAQLQLLAANAGKHRGNPAFMDDAIDTVSNTAARMTRLIEQLRSPDAAQAVRPVDVGQLLHTAVQRSATRPPGVRTAALPAAGASFVMADAERLGAVLEHVIRNAQEAAGPEGVVQLDSITDNAALTLIVRDNGAGMDAAFIRDRLFRPFESTKGSKGMGIGAYQTREYVRQLGGTVEVQSSPGGGTAFLIRLPLCQSPNPGC